MSNMPKLSIEELIMECLEYRHKLKLDQLARCIWEGQNEDEKLELSTIEATLESLATQGLINWDPATRWVCIATRKELITTHSRVFRKWKVWVLGHYSKINSKQLYDGIEIQKSLPGNIDRYFIDVTNECMVVWVYDSVKCDSNWGEDEFRITCRMSDYPPDAFTEYAFSQSTYLLERLSEIPQTTCAYLLFNEMRKELIRIFGEIEIVLDEFEVLEGKQ